MASIKILICMIVSFTVSYQFIIWYYVYALQNDYLPPEWLPLLQVVVGGIGDEDQENSVLFQLLSTVVEAGNENVVVHLPYIVSSLVSQISKFIPPNPEPWPRVWVDLII